MNYPVLRRQIVGMIELTRYAQGRGQIEMSDPKTVHAWRARYFLCVFGAVAGFDQRKERRSPVGILQPLGNRNSAETIVVMRDSERNPAPAVRRVFQVMHGAGGFGGILNHRNHDSFGAGIADAGDHVMVLGRRPHDHRNAGRFEIPDGLFQGFDGEARMLKVEEYIVAAGGGEKMTNPGRCKLTHIVPKLGCSRLRQPLESEFVLVLHSPNSPSSSVSIASTPT